MVGIRLSRERGSVPIHKTPKPIGERWVNSAVVCASLGITRNSLHTWIKMGRFPPPLGVSPENDGRPLYKNARRRWPASLLSAYLAGVWANRVMTHEDWLNVMAAHGEGYER